MVACFLPAIFAETKTFTMKQRLLLIIVLFVIAASANAQIQKGAIVLGGQLGFSSQSSKSTQNTSKTIGFGISPAFGKAIKENLVIGGDINYSYNKNEPGVAVVQKSNSYGLGFFVRKYKELGKGFYLFGQTRLGGSYQKQTTKNNVQPSGNVETKGSFFQLAIYPGLAYSISKKLQLEAGFNNLGYIQYDHSKQTYGPTPNDSIKTNSFSLGSSLSNFSGLTIGFRVVLN
jgi:hypothetical protein